MAPLTFSSLDVLGLILKPIVRFCLKRSVKFQEFSEVSRHIFVQCAEEEIAADGHEVNVSRISVATGMQRRDVSRIWQNQPQVKEPQTVLRNVVGQWRNDKRFCDKAGHPKPLLFKGKESQFAELVTSVSQDVNVYTVLFELERIEAVSKQKELLVLLADTVVPKGDLRRGVELLSADMDDLITAVDENVFEKTSQPNHHVKTYYDNVVLEALPSIREWFLKKGAQFHEEARKYLSKFDKDLHADLSKKPGGARVAIGSFSLIKEPKNEDTSS